MIHPTLSVKLNEDGEYDGIQVKAGLAVKSFKTTGFTSDFESAWLFAKSLLSKGNMFVRRDETFDEYIIDNKLEDKYNWMLKGTEYAPTGGMTSGFIEDVEQA